jgi:hypothetical protein
MKKGSFTSLILKYAKVPLVLPDSRWQPFPSSDISIAAIFNARTGIEGL